MFVGNHILTLHVEVTLSPASHRIMPSKMSMFGLGNQDGVPISMTAKDPRKLSTDCDPTVYVSLTVYFCFGLGRRRTSLLEHGQCLHCPWRTEASFALRYQTSEHLYTGKLYTQLFRCRKVSKRQLSATFYF